MAMRAINNRVEPAYQDLLLLDADTKIESLNILGPNGWVNMGAAYFLMHKKLYFDSPSCYSPSALEGAFDLEYGNWDASFEGPQSSPAQRSPQGAYDIRDSSTDP